MKFKEDEAMQLERGCGHELHGEMGSELLLPETGPGAQHLWSHAVPTTNLPYAHARVFQSLLSTPLLPVGCCHPDQSVSIQGTTNI